MYCIEVIALLPENESIISGIKSRIDGIALCVPFVLESIGMD